MSTQSPVSSVRIQKHGAEYGMLASHMKWICALTVFVGLGCNISKTGDEGVVEFTPSNCGIYSLGCSFSDDMVAGGTVDLKLSDASITEVTSDAPDIVAVSAAAEGGFVLTGVAEGLARISAQKDGSELDSISVRVITAERLTMYPVIAATAKPFMEEAVEVWHIDADTPQSFYLGPKVEDHLKAMGRFAFDEAQLPDEVKAGFLDTDCDFKLGCFGVNLSAGSYPIELSSQNLSLQARLEAK